MLGVSKFNRAKPQCWEIVFKNHFGYKIEYKNIPLLPALHEYTSVCDLMGLYFYLAFHIQDVIAEVDWSATFSQKKA